MTKELTFDTLDITTFKQGVHNLLGWNMQPLSTDEVLQAKDALHCPQCGKLRYIMWKAATTDTPYVYVGGYCVCAEQEASNV